MNKYAVVLMDYFGNVDLIFTRSEEELLIAIQDRYPEIDMDKPTDEIFNDIEKMSQDMRDSNILIIKDVETGNTLYTSQM